jgi:penicillin-binding protein 1A
VTDFISKLKAMSAKFNNSDSAQPSRAAGQTGRSRPDTIVRRVRRRPKSPVSQFFARLQSPMTKSKARRRSESSEEQRTPQQPKRKPLYRRWWLWVLLGIGAGIGGGTFYAYRTVQAVEQKLPDTGNILTFVRDGTLTLKAADGTILQQLGPATRDKLTFDQIPSQLIESFLAAEDQDFYQHNGVDYQAIARALIANVSAGELVEGGSTITQQLARLVFLSQERSFQRKLREALLAQKMERDLDKQQILEYYLNLVYLGSSAYGVADAAWVYFSKTVDQLTLPEIAMIAGMAPAPSVYSPLVDPVAAEQRRNVVLARMLDSGFITQAEMDAAIATPLSINPSIPKRLYSEIPYFTSYVQQQLPQLVSAEELETGGLTVETTVNLEWQRIAQNTVRNAIDNYGPGQNFEQAALVCIDPRNGEIKALVGGDDFSQSQFNRATQAQRQPGSTFKTFVYTAAIASGASPYKTYVDAQYVVDGYEPQNYGRSYRGSVSVRDALISSINVVAVKALIDVGFDPVIKMATDMGIKSELLPTYSLALGASEVNLLELTSAYGTLAAQGNYAEPHGIVRIINRSGEVIYEVDAEPRRVVDETSSAIMTWILQGVVQNGTGARAQLGRPVAGKTGTSEERRDLWFVGYTPQIVTGIWLGNDDSRPTYGASSTAARTWRDFMGTIVQWIPVQEFPELPRLEGRRGSIEAQPVKPGRVSARDADQNSDGAREERQSAPESRRSTTDDEAEKTDNLRERLRDESGSSSGGSAPAPAAPPEAAAPAPPPAAEPAPPEPLPPVVVPTEPVSEPAPPPEAAAE